LLLGILSVVSFIKGKIVGKAIPLSDTDSILLYGGENGAPLANLNLGNTPTNLSDILIDKSDLRGVFGHTVDQSSLQWKSASGEILENMKTLAQNSDELPGRDEFISSTSDKSTGALFAIFHDPFLQYIAVFCIAVFIIFLLIGIWKLYKNKTPKL
jgi:hypothetical protein